MHVTLRLYIRDKPRQNAQTSRPYSGPVTLATRGILFPDRLPTFERFPAPQTVAELVSWFWVPRWNLAPGVTSRQDVLAFPASNLVVESPSPEYPQGRAVLAGPTTARSHRDLSGQGWAVGAHLRPAAVPLFTADPTALQDDSLIVDASELLERVTGSMATSPADAVAAFCEWMADRVADDQGRLANAAADLLSHDPTVTGPEDAAARLAISVRTLQRLTARYVGLPPTAMIRRRRLQEAAERVRLDSTIDLATLAAELGYADHSHLTKDFQRVLAMAPSEYRRHVQ